ncbi:MAG TPA: hypothetical protein VH969_03355 [Actinophytocola sp.]|uniref:hypothetical protein n=1 Tax=Actinophytocola sp. TaxID=1872138 RepID=UPI002F93E17E
MLTHHDLRVADSVVRVAVDPSAGTGSTVWPSIGEYPIYNASLYQVLSEDQARNQRFSDALRTLVPNKVSLDIGTGQHLNWARECLGHGADHVLAMEVMAETFRVASANLRRWGLTDKITLLEGASTSLRIEPRAQVCVAEVIGSIAGAEGAAATFADARRRHLTEDGVVVPDHCMTRAAAVCLRAVLDQHDVAFSPDAIEHLARIFDWNQAPFDVRLRIRNPATEGVVSTDEPVEILDLNGDLRVEQERPVELVMERPGRVDGILLWLQLRCRSGEPPLDTLREQTSWASVYFPLFDTEIPVRRGDRLDLLFRTALSDDGIHPDYEVSAVLHTAGGVHRARHVSPHHGRTFRSRPLYRRLFP